MKFIQDLWQQHAGDVMAVLYNLALVVVIWLCCMVAVKIIRRSLLSSQSKTKRLDDTLLPIVITTLSYLVYIIGVILILDIFGVNTSSIVALLGAAGLAVGFALKDTLSNIAAGIMLLFLRPFKVADTIEFGSVVGTVKELNLFTTILQTVDGLYISAPNSAIWGNSIKNFTRNGTRRMTVEVGISYGDSIELAMETLKKVISEEPRLLTTPAAQVIVVALADSSVNLQLRAWANLDNYWGAFADLHKKVKEEIEAAGLTIPFPQQDVHMHHVNTEQNH